MICEITDTSGSSPTSGQDAPAFSSKEFTPSEAAAGSGIFLVSTGFTTAASAGREVVAGSRGTGRGATVPSSAR
jgi:hypothetical protein